MNRTEKESPSVSVQIGKVVSKTEKTIVVLLVRQVQHPLYGKYINLSKKVHAHDPENACKMGDTVSIKQGRPVSKTKTWHLVDIVNSAEEVNV